MNKDTVLKQIEEKLLPAVKNLENGNASEHDIFPSLLWLLLENNKELERKIAELEKKIGTTEIGISDILEKNKSQNKVLLEHIENLKQTLEVKTSKLEEKIKSNGIEISNIVEDIIQENLKSKSILVNVLERIENLKQTLETKNSSFSVILILCIGFSALAYLIVGR